jgi:hypothetical protein
MSRLVMSEQDIRTLMTLAKKGTAGLCAPETDGFHGSSGERYRPAPAGPDD